MTLPRPRSDLAATARIELLPVRDRADLEVWVAIRNQVAPDMAVSVEEALRSRRLHRERLQLVALLDGEPAGVLDARPWPTHPRLPSLGCELFVLPEARRRGVGRALYAAASAWARERGAETLDAFTFDADPAGLGFARERGYVELERYREVELDLRQVSAVHSPAPDAVELTTLAERPDLERPLHALVVSTLADLPGGAAPPPELPFALFREHVLDAPAFRREAAVLAVAGEELAGFAYLEVSPARPRVGRHRLTGVAPAWRGRGLARALKEHQIAWAKAAGLELLVAENEWRNEPIRRLNDRLGYRPRPDWVVMRGPLAS